MPFRVKNMKILLSTTCESLIGMINSNFGYHIEQRKNGFFAKRNSKGLIPPDGHWQFILACAHLAKNGLHIADIQLSWTELYDALYEAFHFVAADRVGWNGREAKKLTYNAADIINLQNTFGL